MIVTAARHACDEQVKVRIAQADRTIDVPTGATILEAALDAGLSYPFGCQSGNCGACKSHLVKGEVTMGSYSEFALSDEEKARALADYAAGRGFPLMPEVCDYLLTRVSRDLSSLLAMLDALDRYSLETKRPVTVPLARELLAERDAGGRR